MPLSEIVIGERFRHDIGDIDALARNIGEIGLLHPVVITPTNVLIAGRRRIEALRKLGRGTVPVHVVDIERVVNGEYAENTFRKAFAPSEEVAIWRAMHPDAAAQAKARMLATLKKGDVPAVQTLPSGSNGKSRDTLGRIVGKSGWTLAKQVAVVEAAEAEPERFGRLLGEMDRTGRVNGVYKKLQVAREIDEIAKEPPPLPNGPFRVIAADPPWAYQKRDGDPSHRTALNYASMTTEQICDLPVASRAADDCILWLWTTNAHMRDAFMVLDAWGFEQKTILTWVKDSIGTGDWLRGQTEHCLMAVRGKPTVNLTNQSTVLHAARAEHSVKPEAFYALVESLCPGSKLEMFQRREREGWVGHGTES